MKQEKKSILKKWWFWVLVVVLIGSVGGGDEDEVMKTGNTESTQVKDEKNVSKEEIKTESPVVEKTQESQEKQKLDEDTILNMIEILSKRNFDTADIKKTTTENGETLYNVMISNKGFAIGTVTADMNDSKTKKAYDKMVKCMQDSCKKFNELLVENELDGEFVISIVNDLNAEKILFMTTEDTVIYSAFE